jgi:hypothetical protein
MTALLMQQLKCAHETTQSKQSEQDATQPDAKSQESKRITHPSQESTQNKLFLLNELKALASRDSSAQDVIVKAGGIPILVDILETSMTPEEVKLSLAIILRIALIGKPPEPK